MQFITMQKECYNISVIYFRVIVMSLDDYNSGVEPVFNKAVNNRRTPSLYVIFKTVKCYWILLRSEFSGIK